MKYKQPSFYHFNSDSIKLVNFIKKRTKLETLTSICDLGAGCGVIGIELANSLSVNFVDLIELQEEFRESLTENIKNFNLTDIARIKITDFKTLNFKYDLIASNPPYFFSDKSRPSTNIRKKICRFFSKGDEVKFIESVESNLSREGEGFLVIPSNCSYWDSALNSSSLDISDREVDGDIQLVLLKHRN